MDIRQTLCYFVRAEQLLVRFGLFAHMFWIYLDRAEYAHAMP